MSAAPRDSDFGTEIAEAHDSDAPAGDTFCVTHAPLMSKEA